MSRPLSALDARHLRSSRTGGRNTLPHHRGCTSQHARHKPRL